MNNEIEVGEFVRTKKGQIDIFEGTDENYMFARCKNKTYWKLDIVKHSKIKSEIVEVGDYVNGKKVTKVGKYTSDYPAFIIGEPYIELENERRWICEQDEIKTIVTKESFKEREYVF